MKLWLWCALAFALIGGSAYLRSQNDSYVRYVSAPFNDGSRYTFLYPRHMKIISSLNSDLLLRSFPPVSLMDRIRGRLRFGSAVKLLGGMSSHEFSVLASPQTKPFKNSRAIEDYILFVDDSSSGRSFFIRDEYWGTERQHRAQKSKVIMESFQVLAPQQPIRLQ